MPGQVKELFDYQLVNQSVSQSIDQSLNQSVSLSVNQSNSNPNLIQSLRKHIPRAYAV